jgi:excisionase family DNA binding protein
MKRMSTETKLGILKNEILTVTEVASYLRVSRVTVWRWCQQGIIPAVQLGRNWRIRRDEVLNLLETSPPPSPKTTHNFTPSPTSEDRNQVTIY